MKRDYQGKVVLITGAAAGLGRALSQRFARAGARIGGLDVDSQGLRALKAELEASGTAVAVEVCDLTDGEAVGRSIEALRRALGPIDVLVNNAGITHIAAFGPNQAEAVNRVMRVNYEGTVHATAACYEDIVANRGQIAAISSVAGFAPLLGRTGYCASKHALHGFFDTLRLELRHTGVNVLVVCPSYIATGIRQTQEGTDAIGQDGRSRVVGQEATPETVAEAIYRAASSNRRQVAVGRVGWIASWLRRLAPRLYERMMLRRVRDE